MLRPVRGASRASARCRWRPSARAASARWQGGHRWQGRRDECWAQTRGEPAAVSGYGRKNYLRIISDLSRSLAPFAHYAVKEQLKMSATTHVRQHNSILAAAEKRLLIWIAERLPRWIQLRSPVGAWACGHGRRRRRRSSLAGGSRCGRVTCGAVPAAELVRRQPRRHASRASGTSSGRATATTSITSSIWRARPCSLPGWRRRASCRP